MYIRMYRNCKIVTVWCLYVHTYVLLLILGALLNIIMYVHCVYVCICMPIICLICVPFQALDKVCFILGMSYVRGFAMTVEVLPITSLTSMISSMN